VPFIDLQAQRKRLGEPLMRAIAEAGSRADNGSSAPRWAALEEQLAAFAGVKHAVACANGTDALFLILKAWDIGPGDAVFVPSFTFAATAEVVVLAGATPVFVDSPKRQSSISIPQVLKPQSRWYAANPSSRRKW